MTWSLVAAVNDDNVLQSSLLRSPDITDACEVVLKRGFPSAGQAYNAALEDCAGDIVVFAHQDVYLPAGWIAQVRQQIALVQTIDPNWGVLGVFGVDFTGRARGYVYSTGLKSLVGGPFDRPFPAGCVDEMVIVVRRETGLRFDSSLPGFHLYGTEICLRAKELGWSTFVVSAFCIHNSNGLKVLPWAFWRACWHIRQRWHGVLPVTTPCLTIPKSAALFALTVGRELVTAGLMRRSPGVRVSDPSQLLDQCVSERGGRAGVAI